jgi:hypothetical protein
MPLLHQTSKAHADLEEVAPRLGLELATTVSGEWEESDASSQDYHRATSALLISVSMVAVVMAAAAVSLSPEAAVAVSQVELDLFDPSKFQPVCPGSDGVYQLLKYTANALVGDEQFILQLRLACQRCVQVGSQRVHFVLQDERVGFSKMPAQICIHLHGARLAFPKRRQLKRQLANL